MRLRRLNASEASTKSAPWQLSSAKVSRMAWTAASQPPSWPAHSWVVPTACKMLGLMADSVTLPMILLRTSATPIGRTPGFLSRAMSLQAVKADMLAVDTSGADAPRQQCDCVA